MKRAPKMLGREQKLYQVISVTADSTGAGNALRPVMIWI